MLAAVPAVLRFSPASIEGMTRGYLGRISDIPAGAFPGGAPMTGLPPVHLLVSEDDDLRASAELLDRQIPEAGGVVHRYLAEGVLHGHLNRTPALAEVDRSLDFLAAALRS